MRVSFASLIWRNEVKQDWASCWLLSATCEAPHIVMHSMGSTNIMNMALAYWRHQQKTADVMRWTQMPEFVARKRWMLKEEWWELCSSLLEKQIIEAGIGQFEDFRYLVEKDIKDMANEFGKRTIAKGWIAFLLGRTKKLTGVMHSWVKDCFAA